MAAKLETPKLIYASHTFCPGCGHGTISKLLAIVLEFAPITLYLHIRVMATQVPSGLRKAFMQQNEMNILQPFLSITVFLA